MPPFRLVPGLMLLLASSSACAFDFKSVGPQAAILYDAPSLKGGKLFIAPPGMPVEVVLGYGDWVKVRDAAGDLAWTEAKALSARRTVVVRVALARVHEEADDKAPVVMTAERGVLLELADPQGGKWLRVRHRDGISGYVLSSDVWGD